MTLLHRLASIVRWMVTAEQGRARAERRTADVRRHGRRRPGPRRRDAGRGPPAGGAPTRRRRTGEGARSDRPPWRVARRGRAGCPLRPAPGPAQSGVLGDRDRDARARHRRDHGDVQRLRRGADPPAALRRCGPSRDDLGRDMGETDVTSRHNPTPAEWIEWRRLNTVFTDLASQPAGRRDALGRRRARTGSRAEGHLEVLERAWRAAGARAGLHRGRGQQGRARRGASATGCGSAASAARPTSSDARFRSTTSPTK